MPPHPHSLLLLIVCIVLPDTNKTPGSPAQKPQKPGEQARPMRKIIHIDMDCFYAAVEERDDPSLKGRPVAVGGYSEGRGVITTANYEARKYGVRSALSSAVAIERCPHLVLIRPDMQKYVEESKKIRAIFQGFTDKIEPLSLDEAYLDVTGSELFQGSASLLAAEIRRQVFEATGLSASAGIAPNKFLAKVASDWNKPDGQFVIPPGEIASFVEKLPVEKIWGVGKVTAKKLHGLGVTTCGQLQKFSQTELKTSFGRFGESLYHICRGIDHREVVTSRERKSLSIERTFSRDLASVQECLEKMPGLFEKFTERLIGKTKTDAPQSPGSHDAFFQQVMKQVKTLFVKVKFSDFSATTVESSFDSIDLKHFAKLLEQGLERKELPVRLIGLGVRYKSFGPNIATDGPQLLLFDYK